MHTEDEEEERSERGGKGGGALEVLWTRTFFAIPQDLTM